MTNPIHQWLEGKKRNSTALYTTQGYNEALADMKADLPSLLSAMEAEIRKHTLEELLAEIPEDEVYDSDQETGEPKGKYAHIVFGQNQERRRQRKMYAKKLSDIALEE